ncbi:MAG: DUF2059 domain-containing protein [Pseudomonadota bacterium]
MKRILCIVILIFISSHANANEADSSKSSVEKLFSLTGIDEQMDAGFEAMLPMIENQAASLKLGPSAKNELKNIYREWFANDIDRDKVIKSMIDLYADTFTEHEIDELLRFYQSPVGQKFLRESPGLIKAGARLGMEEARSKAYRLQQRLQPFMDVYVTQQNE